MTLGSLPVRTVFPSPRVPSLPASAPSRSLREPAPRDRLSTSAVPGAGQPAGPSSLPFQPAFRPPVTPTRTIIAPPTTSNAYASPKRKTTPGAAASVPRPPKRTTHSLSSTSPFKLRNDRLGTLTHELVRDFESAQSWDEFVSDFRGRSYLAPDLEHLPHPASRDSATPSVARPRGAGAHFLPPVVPRD